jgi:hypothetical protein
VGGVGISESPESWLAAGDASVIIGERMESNERFKVVLLMTVSALLVLACKGDKGDKGDPGERGDPGIQGTAGRDGSPETADQVLSKLNQAVADGGTIELQRSAVYAGNLLGPFTVPHNTFVKAPYANVTHDKLGEFNSTVSRFTATRSGEYLVCAWLTASGTFSPWELEIWINGIRNKSFAYGNTDPVNGGCQPAHLNASDYLEIWVWQGSGASRDFAPNGNWSWLTIHRIG